MATTYFVKDGSLPARTDVGTELSLSEVAERLERYRCWYIGPAPRPLNAQDPGERYQRVVVEVDAGDGVNAKFPKVGFYLAIDLDPSGAQFLRAASEPH
jgi:hypothetical protein